MNVNYNFIYIKKQFMILFLAVCYIKNVHSNKNQVRSIILLLEKYFLKKKLDYFIIKNTNLNNVYVMMIIKTLQLDLKVNN